MVAAPAGSGRLAGLRPVGDPVVIVYGSTDDVFIGQDYIERWLETELWERLRAEGFRRVAYSSSHAGLYFLDAESRRLTRPVAPAQAGIGPGLSAAQDGRQVPRAHGRHRAHGPAVRAGPGIRSRPGIRSGPAAQGVGPGR